MTDITTLSRVQPGSLTTEDINFDLPNIFWKFREVMRAEWCHSRKIYYLEKGFGDRVRLRQVTKLPRKDKSTDPTIQVFKNPVEIDVVKATIANINQRQVLTGVRWELYADFELLELIEMGRFDIVDLLPQHPDRLRQLVSTGVLDVSIKMGALDFDCLITSHTCPKCRQISFGKDLLILVPEWMNCDKCTCSGWGKNAFVDIGAALTLAQRLQNTRSVLPAKPADYAPIELWFIETVATPAFSQLIKHRTVMTIEGVNHNDISHQLISLLYEKSLYKLLKIPDIKALFIKSVGRHFSNRIQRLEYGELPQARVNHLPDNEYRKWLISDWRRAQSQFEDATERVSEIERLLLCTQVKPENILELSDVQSVIGDFPHYLEDILTTIWEEHFDDKKDVVDLK